MFYLLSDGKLGLALGVRTEIQTRSLFSIYALGFTAIAAEILLLHWRAWQLGEPLRLNDRERILTSVGIVALVFALTLPPDFISWSGWIYFSMAISVPVHKRYLRRRLRD